VWSVATSSLVRTRRAEHPLDRGEPVPVHLSAAERRVQLAEQLRRQRAAAPQPRRPEVERRGQGRDRRHTLRAVARGVLVAEERGRGHPWPHPLDVRGEHGLLADREPRVELRIRDPEREPVEAAERQGGPLDELAVGGVVGDGGAGGEDLHPPRLSVLGRP
jgi:hypothetical protein